MGDTIIRNLRERVVKAREEDGEAAGIIGDFEPLIRKCIKMYIKNPEDIEDALQEGRSTIFSCILKYDITSPVPFEGYVKMAVIYSIRDFALKHRVNLSLDEEIREDGGCLYEVIDSGINIEGDAIKKERLSCLWSSLKELTEKERKVIDDFYFKGKTMKEMSMGRRCHYMTVVKHKERILEKLRRAMGE